MVTRYEYIYLFTSSECVRNECFVLQELNSPYDACVPASADLTQLECLEDSDCGRGTCHLGKCRTPWDTWWDTCSDRDKLVITTLRRALEETLERQREEDRLPPFMSSVTYKVPQIPWYTDPLPHQQSLVVVVTNYYKCFFQIFYTKKLMKRNLVWSRSSRHYKMKCWMHFPVPFSEEVHQMQPFVNVSSLLRSTVASIVIN